MSDLAALEKLDQLVSLTAAARSAALQQVHLEDPALHARLLALLLRVDRTGGSAQLLEPVANELLATPAQGELGTGSLVGDYKLLRQIGHGGMSTVWSAVPADGSLQREVAVKLPLGALTSAQQVARFACERDALAKLAHPHIARLYDVGITETGRPFLVLEYVQGLTITDFCNENRLTVRERLCLFLQVLTAVGYAHRNLVVHRDLKPSNILVDNERQVKLLDFGIAKLLADSSARTPELKDVGDWALTLRYSAPEQLLGLPVTVATDVHLLGIVLYEMLAGAHPHEYRGNGQLPISKFIDNILHQKITPLGRVFLSRDAIVSRRHTSARTLQREFRGDLENIVAKCLEGDPGKRYLTVDRLADDIERFLSHQTLSGTQASMAHAVRLFIRRHRGASIAAATGILVAMLLGWFAWQQYTLSQDNGIRAAAVRNFLFFLVSDFEPYAAAASRGAPSTYMIDGRRMLDDAVKRAREQFSLDPRLLGELLCELGRMYTRLGEVQKSADVFKEALALLEANAPSYDPILNKTRAHLADHMIQEDVAEARKLGETALDACNSSVDDECAKARAYALSALSKISMYVGQPAQSIQQMRRSVVETRHAFGTWHSETAVSLTNLAITARNGGRFQIADTAIKQAASIAKRTMLRSGDQVTISMTTALIDFDLGRYELARQRFSTLLKGAHSDEEQVTQQRLLSYTLLAQGEPALALARATDALATARDMPDTTHAILLDLVRLRALAQLGRCEEALDQMVAVLESLSSSHDAKSPITSRAKRAYAEILVRSGKLAAALEATAEVQGNYERARMLDIRGYILASLGKFDAALEAHRHAYQLLAAELPRDHPIIELNLLYQGRINLQLRRMTSLHGEVLERIAAWRRTLPESSKWHDALDKCVRLDICELIVL